MLTFNALIRSPRAGNPSKSARAIYSFDLACLKNECFNNFFAEGLFEGSFTKQLAIICLKDLKETKERYKERILQYN